MALIFHFVLMMLELIIIFFHSVGLYLLRCLHRDGRKTVQQIYIMNLSFAEILLNIFYFIVTFLVVLLKSKVIPMSKILADCFTYIEIGVTNTGLTLVYYMCRHHMLVDKLAEVFWNIRYPQYWTISKTKYLVFGTWLIGFIMGVGFIIAYHLTRRHLEYYVPLTYFYIALNCTFIITAIVSYGYIFYKFHQTRGNPLLSTPEVSLWETFRNSRFYLSSVLILSFVLLVLVPDVTTSFLLRQKEDAAVRIFIRRVCPVLYHISYLSDAWIYIFIHPPVKRLLMKKVASVRCLHVLVACRSASQHEGQGRLTDGSATATENTLL